ncbi:MAG: hypothetical protein ACYCUI_16820 [Vulcanimicrobiaceae bacterium]
MGFFSDVWSGIKGAVSKVGNAVKSATSWVASKAGKVVNTIVGGAKAVGHFVIQKAPAVLNGIKDVANKVIEAAPKIIASGKDLINSVNPLSGFSGVGIFLIAGLGIWALLEFSKTDTAKNLSRGAANAAPMMIA